MCHSTGFDDLLSIPKSFHYKFSLTSRVAPAQKPISQGKSMIAHIQLLQPEAITEKDTSYVNRETERSDAK